VTILACALVACSAPAKHVVVAPPPTDDPGRARLLLLTHADLPDGWRASSHAADPVSDRENRRVASCTGAPDPVAVETANVFGKDVGQGAQLIGSEAVFVRTATDAAQAVAALRGPRAISCATASVRPILAEQLRRQGMSASVRSLRVTRFTLRVGGFVTAFRIVATLSAFGATLTILEDVVFLAKGRAQVRTTFLDVGTRFPSALELVLVKKLSSKLSAA